MNESNPTERLDPQRIAEGLSIPLSVLLSVDSTNTEARRRILDAAPMPQIILAEEQSAGRGRMGRSFFSPDGVGIYLSLAFSPSSDRDPLLLTTSAAVATLRAIEEVTGVSCSIKWVNDLYLGDRKVCGILAESLFWSDRRYVILGVGVNLYTRDFPEELRSIAGALLPEKKGMRNSLAAALCRELSALIDDPLPDGFLDLYRERSMILGRAITYTENQLTREGVAESIDERGRLLIRHADGSDRLLASGEISLRLKQTESENE